MGQAKETVGAAVFVKTIGLSPLKTRLAATIGKDQAHQFYGFSCRAIYETLLTCKDITPYWAVAEGRQGFSSWEGCKLEQGTGELGERLGFVYKQLLEKHRWGILLGGDAPQLSPDLFQEALRLGADGSFVIGPSQDGGFYLMLGSKPVPQALWCQVPYSCEQTAERLIHELEAEGNRVKKLGTLSDVDTFADIPPVLDVLQNLKCPNSAQKNLKTWLASLQQQYS